MQVVQVVQLVQVVQVVQVVEAVQVVQGDLLSSHMFFQTAVDNLLFWALPTFVCTDGQPSSVWCLVFGLDGLPPFILCSIVYLFIYLLFFNL